MMTLRLKDTLFIFLLALSCGMAGAIASEIRAYTPIMTPKTSAQGEISVSARKPVRPVSNKTMLKVVRSLMQAWNSNQLSRLLGEEFFDRTRLGDAMSEKVPRDAKLKVLSIQNMQTLEQHIETDEKGRLMVSLVSVRISSQLEFNDPVNGFQRREGTNEYVFRVKQRMRS